MMWPGFGWGMGGLGWLVGIVVLGLIIWGIVTLARGAGHGGPGSGPAAKESALDILKRRYANGEINKEEFEEKKKAII
jgi:putative membrane protein